MAIPVWVPGQVLTAADINNWLVPNAVVKPSDQSVTSSTTLILDTAMFAPMLANAAYVFTCFLDYEGGTLGASDMKWNFGFPAGATLVYTPVYQDTSGTVFSQLVKTGATITAAGTNGAAALRSVQMTGSVKTTGTGGNLFLQWAQNTSSGTATIIHAGSYLSLQRTS